MTYFDTDEDGAADEPDKKESPAEGNGDAPEGEEDKEKDGEEDAGDGEDKE